MRGCARTGSARASRARSCRPSLVFRPYVTRFFVSPQALVHCGHVFKHDSSIITMETLGPFSLLLLSLFSLRVPGVSASTRADTHPAPFVEH